MKKLLNWIFGPVKKESEEDEEKRIAEINSTLDDLQNINSEIKKKEKELEALNKFLNQR
jgi:flagellar hook-associated protein FlgK